MTNAKEILAKAKVQLVIHQPFFASILLSLPILESTDVETFATNGSQIFYNPEFLKTLTLPEVIFILAHETLHCVFMHMFRRGERNSNKWNIAADHVINDLLVTDGIGKMPDGGLLDKSLIQRGGGTADGIYAILPKSAESKKPGDKNGGALDDCLDATKPGDAAANSQAEADMRVKIIQAKNAAKMVGKLSAGIARLVETIAKPKTDWRVILRNFLSDRAKITPSYARPKRRFLADDLYLPSLVGERLGPVVIAIDCSGSVDQKQINYFGAELNAILEDARPSGLKVVYFDAKVLETVDVDVDALPVKLEARGGGGTKFSPIFAAVDAMEIAPVAVVVLTDLDAHDFGTAPEYPVLWASIRLTSAPWGDIVMIGAKND